MFRTESELKETNLRVDNQRPLMRIPPSEAVLFGISVALIFLSNSLCCAKTDFLVKGLGSVRRVMEVDGWGGLVGVGFWKSFGQCGQKYPERLENGHSLIEGRLNVITPRKLGGLGPPTLCAVQ